VQGRPFRERRSATGCHGHGEPSKRVIDDAFRCNLEGLHVSPSGATDPVLFVAPAHTVWQGDEASVGGFFVRMVDGLRLR
jgi:hypothetical protein